MSKIAEKMVEKHIVYLFIPNESSHQTVEELL
jgi:hypothetical protein